MFESLGLENWTPVQAALVFGVMAGVIFGVIAQVTQFCLRRSIAGAEGEKKSAAAVWLMGLTFAVIGTQVALSQGWISVDENRFLDQDVAVYAIIVGGLMFGAGMFLTRGCLSRLLVLSGSGNLRAMSVLVLLAIAAHATLKGVLAPVRVWLGSFTVPFGDMISLNALPGGQWAVVGIIAVLVFGLALSSSANRFHLLLGGLLGLLVPLAWWVTGYVLLDDFDPIPVETLSFTLPATQSLFWLIASSSVSPGFGVGLIGGVILGSLLAHVVRGQVQFQSFESPRQTGRYFLGAFLMGVGGVFAGGCSVGAGIAGVATLSTSALLALVSIVMGCVVLKFIMKD